MCTQLASVCAEVIKWSNFFILLNFFRLVCFSNFRVGRQCCAIFDHSFWLPQTMLLWSLCHRPSKKTLSNLTTLRRCIFLWFEVTGSTKTSFFLLYLLIQMLKKLSNCQTVGKKTCQKLQDTISPHDFLCHTEQKNTCGVTRIEKAVDVCVAVLNYRDILLLLPKYQWTFLNFLAYSQIIQLR